MIGDRLDIHDESWTDRTWVSITRGRHVARVAQRTGDLVSQPGAVGQYFRETAEALVEALDKTTV